MEVLSLWCRADLNLLSQSLLSYLPDGGANLLNVVFPILCELNLMPDDIFSLYGRHSDKPYIRLNVVFHRRPAGGDIWRHLLSVALR